MRQIATFVVGFAAGAIAVLAFQQAGRWHSVRHATPGNFDIRFAVERTSFGVDYELPVYLTDSSGTEFRIDFQPDSHGQVEYRWSVVADPSRTGNGTLFEKYETVGETEDGRQVKDVGSQRTIDIEDLQIEWSSGGASSGWIYFHPADIAASMTPSGEPDVDRGD